MSPAFLTKSHLLYELKNSIKEMSFFFNVKIFHNRTIRCKVKAVFSSKSINNNNMF